ncbi:MAG: hypothetical protein ACRENJ_10320 [Candidatus Eiseniibacteriota bacterium]
MTRRTAPRSLARAAVLSAALMLAAPAASEVRESAAPHFAGMRTGTLRFPPPGVMIVALGVEYMPDVTNDLAGVRGAILRLPALGLRLGLADQAMFQVSWPAYNRLRVDEQQDPPPLGRRLGRVSTDWGDVTVATLIRLRAEQGGWPACGLRFAAELPTSNEELGIGDNTTDVFASLLLARTFASRLGVYTDLGVGILTERTRTFAQNDVLTYGILTDWPARGRLHLVGELAGQWSTRGGLPGTGSRGELRAGVDLGRGAFHWTALAVHGLTGRDSRGLGVALHVSTRLTVLEVAGPAPRP